MAASRGSRSRLGAKLLLLLASTLAALATVEVGLRLAPGAISAHLLVLFEPGLRAGIAAGSYPLERDTFELPRDDGGPPLRILRPTAAVASIDTPRGARVVDEIGFCNVEGRYSGAATIEVILLGDSFTWCHGVAVEESWAHLLGVRAGVSTYNLGRGGSGLHEHVQLLKRFGLPKRPRTVIVNVYGGNDLRDAVYYESHRETVRRTGQPPSDAPQNAWPALRDGPLGRTSYVLNLALAFASRALHEDATDAERRNVNFRYEIDFDGGPVEFNVENSDRDEVVFARRLLAGDAKLELFDPPLAELASIAREHGFALVVSYTPSAHDAYGARVRFADPSLGPLLRRAGDAQRAHFARRATELGYAFHDLTPALRAAAESSHDSLLYDPGHLHLTARGNAVVAESLAAFLGERRSVAAAP